MPETWIQGSLLLLNTLWDIRKREILLTPTLAILMGGVIRSVLAGSGGDMQWLPALMPGVFLLLVSIAADGKVGFGDGLVVCAAGLWGGAVSTLIMLVLAFSLVPAAAGLMRLMKRQVRELPFMPFLLAGFLLERFLFQTGAG